ncbi:MAG: four helix bundle protein [Candidatus Undinarchaeales archaeon]|jgi:four helix bundle protein|nr:four helix bundle protein [Candidatus Undinarchaeales archaeon]
MQDFTKLEIYQEAQTLALDIYTITKKFPGDERFGMVQQLKRASTSIGANISEGAGRSSNKDFSRFLFNSVGSLNELLHFLMLAHKLKYITTGEWVMISEKSDKLGRKINKFLQSLSR